MREAKMTDAAEAKLAPGANADPYSSQTQRTRGMPPREGHFSVAADKSFVSIGSRKDNRSAKSL